MSDAFRNVVGSARDPVETWPYEAIVATIERGTIRDWIALTKAFDRQPWGEVARAVEEYLGYERPYGVAPLLERAIGRARDQAQARERARVAAEVAELVAASGLTLADFARRIGTSASRLSTYRSGRVVPSATMMLRMREVGRALCLPGPGSVECS